MQPGSFIAMSNPENIMLRPDGFIKVLDFGLAKLTEKSAEWEAAGGDPEAATRALVHNRPGIVMGTISYMSPEQARGLRADERTDIFSLGVVSTRWLRAVSRSTGPRFQT
jgi:serine/threonine protein kinase